MTTMGVVDGVLDPSKKQNEMWGGARRYPRKTRERLRTSNRQAAKEMLPKITERDMRIIETLHVIGVLSRHQIERLEWGHCESRHVSQIVSNRLLKLYKRWIVDANPHVGYEMERDGLVPCNVYMLDKVGHELLALSERVNPRDLKRIQRDYQKGYGKPSFIIHDLMVAEAYTNFALELENRNDVRGMWIGEFNSSITSPDPKDPDRRREWVRADAIMVFKHTKEENSSPFHYFLEVDRVTRTVARRWAEKAAAYDSARRQGQWKDYMNMTAFPGILAIVPDGFKERVADAIKHEISRHSVPNRWYIKEWGQLLEEGLLPNWYDLSREQAFDLV